MASTLSNNFDDVEGLAETVQADRCRTMWIVDYSSSADSASPDHQDLLKTTKGGTCFRFVSDLLWE